jgi:hypothetical protein
MIRKTKRWKIEVWQRMDLFEKPFKPIFGAKGKGQGKKLSETVK